MNENEIKVIQKFILTLGIIIVFINLFSLVSTINTAYFPSAITRFAGFIVGFFLLYKGNRFARIFLIILLGGMTIGSLLNSFIIKDNFKVGFFYITQALSYGFGFYMVTFSKAIKNFINIKG